MVWHCVVLTRVDMFFKIVLEVTLISSPWFDFYCSFSSRQKWQRGKSETQKMRSQSWSCMCLDIFVSQRSVSLGSCREVFHMQMGLRAAPHDTAANSRHSDHDGHRGRLQICSANLVSNFYHVLDSDSSVKKSLIDFHHLTTAWGQSSILILQLWYLWVISWLTGSSIHLVAPMLNTQRTVNGGTHFSESRGAKICLPWCHISGVM